MDAVHGTKLNTCKCNELQAISGVMTSDNTDQHEQLFQTPNPTELKAAAKNDPIQDRETSREMIGLDDASNPDREADQEQFDLDDETAIASPIVKANLSGH